MNTVQATVANDAEHVSNSHYRFLPYVIFILAASFYLYEFILQVAPSVMKDALMADWGGVGAAMFGTASAFYYYAYAPMQIPAGLLYDRFGPRRLLTFAIVICAAGAVLFAYSTGIFLASSGRFLMGVGSAFSFIGVLVLTARWFPPKYFALLAGIAQLMSSVGAITGEVSLSSVLEQFSWQETTLGLSVVGFLLAMLVFFVVRDWPANASKAVQAAQHKSNEWQRLKEVCTNSQTWYVGLYTFLIWGPVLFFAALWGVPYLQKVYHISPHASSEIVMWIWIGIAIGSPLFGWWSDYLGRRCMPLALCAAIGLVTAMVIEFVPHVPMLVMSVLMFLIGFAASGQIMSFAVIKDINKPQLFGTASGFNNMATVLGGAVFQPLIGLILKFEWNGTISHGVHVYSTHAYHVAMLILPGCYFIALLAAMFLIKETHAKPLYTETGEPI